MISNSEKQKEQQQMTVTSTYAYARQKLIDWNFDPDNLSVATSRWYSSPLRQDSIIPYGPRKTRPMILFAQLGELRVLQYILDELSKKNGGDPAVVHAALHQTDEYELFPLYMAISEPHSEDKILEVCQWLHQKGASLQQCVASEWSALSRACLKGYGKVALWLIKNGALLLRHNADESGGSPVFSASLARRDLPSLGVYNGGVMGSHFLHLTQHVHKSIFAWAHNILATNDAFRWVLRGTIPPRFGQATQDKKALQETVLRRISQFTASTYSSKSLSFLIEEVPMESLVAFYNMTLSPLRFLSGHPGILENIASFVGVTTDKNLLCTARGLVEHELWWQISSLSKER